LPNSGYGFRVSLRHGSGVSEYTSPTLDTTYWTIDIPGGTVGEWRWSVAIVRRDSQQNAIARSDEWTFYYAPFTFDSPILP
jgi:hypothetical protein